LRSAFLLLSKGRCWPPSLCDSLKEHVCITIALHGVDKSFEPPVTICEENCFPWEDFGNSKESAQTMSIQRCCGSGVRGRKCATRYVPSQENHRPARGCIYPSLALPPISGLPAAFICCLAGTSKSIADVLSERHRNYDLRKLLAHAEDVGA